MTSSARARQPSFGERDVERLAAMARRLAHQLNNLFTATLGYCDLASTTLPDGHPAAALLSEAVAANNRGIALARDLLLYASRGPVEREQVDFNAVLADEVKRNPAPRGARVQMALEPGLPPVFGDPRELRRMAAELLEHAAAVTPPGGAIRLFTSLVDGAAQLSVSDDGPGMDAETASRVFDPFSGSQRSCRGIGLAVAAGVARRHGATLTLYTAPGAGATFQVLFPAR